jgi:hypothetical protein
VVSKNRVAPLHQKGHSFLKTAVTLRAREQLPVSSKKKIKERRCINFSGTTEVQSFIRARKINGGDGIARWNVEEQLGAHSFGRTPTPPHTRRAGGYNLTSNDSLGVRPARYNAGHHALFSF